MRILVFHGYLLGGTGSNVYNAALAEAFARAGHEVHLLSQDRDPLAHEWVDAAGDWDSGELEIVTRREGGRGQITVYRPDIAGLLPLYVADRYEGVEARPFPDLSDEELDRYLERNVAAVREVASRVRPDVALANHLVMGPAILARALAGTGIPYAVKIHGSALEYTVKPHPRFLPYAREGLEAASGVLVGSRHTAESLWAALPELPDLEAKTRLGPPGVDTNAFRPGEGTREPTVVFVGKLIVSKGLDLLLAAWPLVRAEHPAAKLVVAGYGGYEQGLRRLLSALDGGDLGDAREVARLGRALEGGEEVPLSILSAFLDEPPAGYVEAARGVAGSIDFVGRLEHDEVARLLPGTEVLVMPSTFPEAFGMVAVEAAACGVLPLSADHSGMREVSRRLAAALPAGVGELTSFAVAPGAVEAIAAGLNRWLSLAEGEREAARGALAETARRLWSWEGVARGVLAASRGELDRLPLA